MKLHGKSLHSLHQSAGWRSCCCWRFLINVYIIYWYLFLQSATSAINSVNKLHSYHVLRPVLSALDTPHGSGAFFLSATDVWNSILICYVMQDFAAVQLLPGLWSVSSFLATAGIKLYLVNVFVFEQLKLYFGFHREKSHPHPAAQRWQ